MSRKTKRFLWVGGFLIVALLVVAGALVIRERTTDRSLEESRAAYARGDWEGARLAARKRIEKDTNDIAAWLLLARSASRAGKHDSAQSIYQDRVGMDRMEAEDFLLLGRGLAATQQISAAIAVLGRGLKVDPKYPEILMELCRLSALENGLKQSVKFAERVAEIPGWEARGSVLLGALYAEMSEPAETAKNLGRALSLDPQLKGAVTTPPKARKLYARALLKLGKSAEAEAQLKQVLAAGKDIEASWLLGRAYLQQGMIREANLAQNDSLGYGDESVYAHEPSPFVGSAKCAPCHQAIFDSQQNSLHANTFYATKDLGKITWPDKPMTDRFNSDVVHSFSHEGDKVSYQTKVKDEVYRAVIDYAIGSGDRGLTLIGHNPKNEFQEIRLSKYNDGSGWDLTIGQKPLLTFPQQYLGHPLSSDELYGCVNCHTTDGHAAIEKLEPLVADHGIGCERCHGPGANHIKALEGKFKEMAIERPGSLSADRLVKMCAQCHSPIGNVTLNPEDKTTLRFQGVHFVKSRCYTESNGKLSCITCHSPHRNAEESTRYYELKCLSCHSAPTEGAPTAGGESHTPCPVNPSKDCLTCHMPVEKTAIPHASFSDHYIRVHRELPVAASR